MVSPLAAAKAYAVTQGQGLSDLGGAKAASGADFGDMVKSAMTEVMHNTKTAETQIARQVQGKAELIDVVTAISAAEASLETVMAVRDQVIQAYQEIMRMPI
ncbi:MAG: flagellar hook-basal body complex protein FliE [Phenylobacterium sp.]|uniref:flagellar hook-basal body complex protein FliE n=1 Tax=Phenylobacterium sp. TaxID=1871053 RepID=UPI00391D09A6